MVTGGRAECLPTPGGRRRKRRWRGGQCQNGKPLFVFSFWRRIPRSGGQLIVTTRPNRPVGSQPPAGCWPLKGHKTRGTWREPNHYTYVFGLIAKSTWDEDGEAAKTETRSQFACELRDDGKKGNAPADHCMWLHVRAKKNRCELDSVAMLFPSECW